MALQDNGYIYKPSEQPFMAGSPASPLHSGKRQLAYVLIGLLLIFCAGLQNGLMTANLSQVRGVVQMANMEARILAYNDLFSAIWLVVSVLFILKFMVWAYRRYHKIDVLEVEMQKLQAYLASDRSQK